MTDTLEISCTTASGKTLDTLEGLVAKRAEQLGETTKDAVVAAAIDVLVSLRSGTKDAKRTKRFACKVEELPGLVPGYEGGREAPRRILRTRGGARYDAQCRVKWLNHGLRNDTLKVFRVTPEHGTIGPYIVVAADSRSAANFEAAATKHRITDYGTLAKWALGVAMNKLSTRNVSDGVSSKARLAGSKLAFVASSGSGFGQGDYSVEVTDALGYAYSAMTHGSAEVEIAMRKAANKIAGLITHAHHLAGDFENDVVSPFPDIIRRR